MTDSIRSRSILSSFRERAIRTVMLVDDSFPSYSDYAPTSEVSDVFSERETAHRLYNLFRNKSILCEVTNNVDELTPDKLERVRKCDLIVLDLHLNVVDNTDVSDSIRILADLADSHHFNIVTVYTKKTDIEEVWLEIAANLRGDWATGKQLFEDNETHLDLWNDFVSDGNVPEPSRGLLKDAILGKRDYCGEVKEILRIGRISEFTGRMTRQYLLAVYGHWANQLLVTRYPAISAKRRNITGTVDNGAPPWILCGNVFIVIMKKDVSPGDESSRTHATAPEQILEKIDLALLDWNPNLLRLLLSELQNSMIEKPIAHRENSLSDKLTEAGWFYFILKNIQGKTFDDHTLEQALRPYFDYMMEHVKIRALTEEFKILALENLHGVLENKSLECIDDSSLARMACEFADCPKKTTNAEIVHMLNLFLSSIPFSGNHVTNGTIFCSDDSEEWWLCATPACDMDPRKPSGDSWFADLHPIRPMLAFKLEKKSGSLSQLNIATHSRSLFLRYKEDLLTFSIFHEITMQPSQTTFFLVNQGFVSVESDDSNGEKKSFQACRINLKRKYGDKPIRPSVNDEEQFTVVAQLRDAYANRFLQQAGFHLSRIGVDFVNYSENASRN